MFLDVAEWGPVEERLGQQMGRASRGRSRELRRAATSNTTARQASTLRTLTTLTTTHDPNPSDPNDPADNDGGNGHGGSYAKADRPKHPTRVLGHDVATTVDDDDGRSTTTTMMTKATEPEKHNTGQPRQLARGLQSPRTPPTPRIEEMRGARGGNPGESTSGPGAGQRPASELWIDSRVAPVARWELADATGAHRSTNPGLRPVLIGPTDVVTPLLCDGEVGKASDGFHFAFGTVRPGDLGPTGTPAMESRQVHADRPGDLRPTGTSATGNCRPEMLN